MKKFFAIAAMAVATLFSANVMNAQSLEKYAKEQYGNKWTAAALTVAEQNALNEDGSLTFTKTIEAPGMSQEDLYYSVADWFISNYQNSIQLAEKADGVIVARPYISDFACSAAGWNAYRFDICPTVRVKVTDGMVNISYNLKDYGVAKNIGGGNVSTAVALGAIAGIVAVDIACPSHSTTVYERHHHHGHHHTVVEHHYHNHSMLEDALLISCIASMTSDNRYDDQHVVWNINDCYPYSTNDSHKKASAKALVMATTLSQCVLDNIEASINSQVQMACNK